ncbi:hypothetical protein BC830DRAFT_1145381 [Chytriomyces sp. MP71]|nr:hypothetical protein BC830DRAFT_1145381 [Chytriomyces sp. MP71]
MPKLHSPLPQELQDELAKAGSILDHFIKGDTQLDQTMIPPKVLANAKGVAVITIVKAGFIWSGRGGAGLVVAKLSDGRWSAPSAIAAGGAGVGAQIGAEVTDTVFILNTESAVKAFSHGGNVTFGANLSVAAGPMGRSAEAAGSLANVAPIYSYSKTKGLFAGVSLEGLVIVTRQETNARFYGSHVTPQDLLSGKVPPPPQAEVLYRALNRKGFGSMDHLLEAANNASTGIGAGTGKSPTSVSPSKANANGPPPALPPHPSKRPHANSGETQSQVPPPPPPKPQKFDKQPIQHSSSMQQHPPPAYQPGRFPEAKHASTASQSPIPPRPTPASMSSFLTTDAKLPPPTRHPLQIKTVTALYDYHAERPGDISFIAGDLILVSKEDGNWWEGELRGVKGVFPSNYVQ